MKKQSRLVYKEKLFDLWGLWGCAMGKCGKISQPENFNLNFYLIFIQLNEVQRRSVPPYDSHVPLQVTAGCSSSALSSTHSHVEIVSSLRMKVKSIELFVCPIQVARLASVSFSRHVAPWGHQTSPSFNTDSPLTNIQIS